MRSSRLSSGIISGILLILTAGGYSQSPIHEFSLEQALSYGFKNNVQVKNSLLDLQVQMEVNRGITSAAFPQVKATGSFTDNIKIPVSLVPGEFFGQPGTFVPLQFGVKYNATGGIELNQLLFDGQVFVGLQARATSLDYRRKNIEVTQEGIKANIYKIYYQLLASRTQIDLLNANIERLQKLHHETSEIYKNGFAAKLDVDRVSVQLANLQTEKDRTMNTISNGYLGLKLLLGMPLKDSLVLTDSLNYDRLKEGLLVEDSFNYNNRKEYQLAELGIKLGEYNIKRYKLSKLPTLNLDAYYNKNAQRNDFNFFKGSGPNTEWFSISAFTLRLNIPIFTGFAANANIRQAKLQLQQSLNQRDYLKLSIENDILTAKNNFQSAIQTMDYQKQNMDLAAEVFEQSRKKFEAGTGSTQEINTAQTDYKAAQTSYITALYEAIIAKVDYLKATGKL